MFSKIKFFTLLLLILLSTACANPKHTAVVVDSALYETLNGVFNTEQALLSANTPQWTLEKSQAFNKKLLPAVAAGRSFNTLLANWKTGDPIPAQLHDGITGIIEALKQVTTDMPDGTTKTKILTNLASAQSIILTALNLILTLKGA